MKRKLVSVVALMLCLITVLLCGCNLKKTKNSPSSSPAGESTPVNGVTNDESTSADESTTLPAEEVKKPASSAVDKVTSSKTDKVNTTTPAVKKDEWKKEGEYTCGKNLDEGEYYIVPTGKNCSVKITDGKNLDEDEILDFDVLPFGLFVTIRKGYTLELSGGKLIASSAVEKMGKNGSYELGSYRVGVDIPAGETTIKVAGGNGYIIYDSSDYLDPDNMAFVGIGYYPEYVNLKKGQIVWFLDDAIVGADVADAKANGSYGEGMYKVGKDLNAGKYDIVPTDSENAYAVYYDLKHIELSCKAYDENIVAPVVVTLKDGEYIEFVGCNLVPHVDAPTAETTTEADTTTTTEADTTTTEPDSTTTTAPSGETDGESSGESAGSVTPEPAGDS